MVDDKRIRKTKIKAREFFQTVAEIQFESGYPYIMFEDTVNRANPIDGKITMSNLCSEILQVSQPTTYHDDLSYNQTGKDISCNLGSLNIAKTMDSPDFGLTIETAIRSLSAVSDMSNITSVPSIARGNDQSHAIGLGQMNLHGYLARERVHYGSEEGLDFTNIYFYSVVFHAVRASNRLAIQTGQTFGGFEKSKYASGEFFDKYTEQEWVPQTAKVAELFKNIHIPTQDDWRELKASVMEHGIYNQNLQAVPPTRLDLLHQQLHLLDPPGGVQDRDPQGRQAGPRVLPGAVPDERQPGVLPGRVRDRLREGHRHLRRRHAARGPGPVPDAVLQGHRHHARHQQGPDLRLEEGHQDHLLHPSPPARAGRDRGRGLRFVHVVIN